MYIIVDGIEGSGKSSIIAKFAEDYDCVKVFEPGYTGYGKEIRQLLLFKNQGDMDSIAEAFLFMADRRQTFAKTILPALDSGKLVISDRGFTSTYAHQVVAQGMKEYRHTAMLEAAGLQPPDLIVIIDLDVHKAKERILHKAPDRFEKMDYNYHHKVRHGYLKIADIVINGDQEFDDVYKEFCKEVDCRGAEEWKRK